MRSAPGSAVRGALSGALAVALVVAALWAIGVTHPARAPHPQGDMLGMQEGESADRYLTRAAASIGNEPAFALVTFTQPVDAESAARMLAPVGRVSALVVGAGAPIVVTEPTAGTTRAEVFSRATHTLIDGAVVHDTGTTLRTVAAQTGVYAVEALPPDAAWGAFTVAHVQPR